ncbi:hypothetical protein DW781_10470 [Olsenella sp. AM30-3LB]|uniref:hypothetical protein n=1 Tax=Olsenella sp. AM30-3LB TaxID=2292359 RepID=UPI000E54EDAE|nr:hypothetical protein [Olsenella sp. AM30-3LB]RHD71613.1 hypothetical protein DW781_10470 [Olsenella sp. AM30-3LB]
MGRRMLGMGGTTIDEVTVRAVKGRKGLRRITWRLGLGDGTTVQCRTEGRCSAAELRERARRQAERRLAEHLGTWADRRHAGLVHGGLLPIASDALSRTSRPRRWGRTGQRRSARGLSTT